MRSLATLAFAAASLVAISFSNSAFAETRVIDGDTIAIRQKSDLEVIRDG